MHTEQRPVKKDRHKAYHRNRGGTEARNLRDDRASPRGARSAAPLSQAPTERVLGRLERVKKNGEGWKARCPAHDDRNPSLSVSEGKDGRALVYCHAGCSFKGILAALGMDKTDLFPDSRPQ